MNIQNSSENTALTNPFKIEGILYSASGTILIALGVLSLFLQGNDMLETGQAAGWLKLALCLVMLVGGVAYVTKGLLLMFRFRVGRAAPSSLSKNEAKGEKHGVEEALVYTPEELDQLLVNRNNSTYRETSSWLERMMLRMVPTLPALPYSMRNHLHMLVRSACYSVLALLIYWLALLSSAFGLTRLTQSSFASWLGLGLACILLLLWLFHAISVKPAKGTRLWGGKGILAGGILLSLLAPVAGEAALRQGFVFPEAPIQPALHLIALYLLIPLLMMASLILAKYRSELYERTTEVSEFREHWQENVHPKDFFSSLDIELANLRVNELPNRVYRELSPSLHMEGSMDKGSFIGNTIQETQPVFEALATPPLLQKLRLYTSIAGHLLIVLAAVLLFTWNQQSMESLAWREVFNGIYFPLLLGIFGSAAQTLAHLFWSEVHFTSYLIHFQVEGSYSESERPADMSTSNASTSGHILVSTSFSPWLLVSRLRTSTHASSSGSGNLMGPRFVLSMDKADEVLAHLVGKIRSFLGERALDSTLVANDDEPQALQALEPTVSRNEADEDKS